MKVAIPIGWGDDGKYKINAAYIDFVAGAGYQPLIISPENNPAEIAKFVDGLLLPGGIDLDPMFYGENNISSFWCDPKKDAFERELFWNCVINGKPVFGICRGHQLIAREYLYNAGENPVSKGAKKTVADRLEFIQHIDKHEMAGGFHLFRGSPHHFVYGRVDTLFGETETDIDMFAVNSMHHQAVYTTFKDSYLYRSQRLSDHMNILAWTERGLSGDEGEEGCIVEALEILNWSNAPIMSVQWHPEEMKDYRLLQNFFNRAAGGNKQISGVAQ